MNNKKTFKNHWIDNEVRSLKTELKCGKQPNIMFYKLLAMSLLLLFISINAFGDSIYIYDNCPHCNEELEIKIPSIETVRYFPDTWHCSNPKCKYENYEGINYCALCGTKRKG